MGFSIIEVGSKSGIDPALRGCIEQFTQATIGPEIMEETLERIIIKDLIDPKEMPFNKTLNRMYLLVKSMHEEAINALIRKDKGIAMDIISRDSNIDRLHWLVARQVNLISKNSILMKEMRLSPEETVHFLIISRILERIGDHAVRIAENALKIIKTSIDKVLVEKIVSASSQALKILKESFEALERKNIEKANNTFLSMKELTILCEDIHNAAIQLKG